MAAEAAAQITPVAAFALIGVMGVGAQWLAWRLRMPAIVLMLAAGLLVGPATGLLLPARDIGPLLEPLVSVAVAIILFEGGLSLDLADLRDAAAGVQRLVFIGAPLGWIGSALVLHYAAGLGWESAAVIGGIMIVTGPTVITPLLRNARLARRPAQLLHWEAILNDPIGALAAVLAFEVVAVLHTPVEPGPALVRMLGGVGLAALAGAASGLGLAAAFRRGRVPEYMKVPVLVAVLLLTFALPDAVLHESGLLAVTIMGVVVANAGLPSYDELRRFKEQASILLVSGVFILLAAELDFGALARLDWRAVLFVLAVMVLARPAAVFIALLGTAIPWRERVLVAFTGPRGVVLVAVAGLFGERLAAMGLPDGTLIGPLAFVLVAVTVVVHGFTLGPLARALGLAAADRPGVLLVGGSAWTMALAEALSKAEIPVLVTDPNRGHLRAARAAGIATFAGEILSKAAEQRLELMHYATLIAATDNDAYNTLVATDLAPEFGRDNVYQVTREKADSARHALPPTLGGRSFGPEGATHAEMARLVAGGWTFRVTRLTDEFGLQDWRKTWPEARLLGQIAPGGQLRLLRAGAALTDQSDLRLLFLAPPDPAGKVRPPVEAV
ncbi:MAG: sodium:proton antiporter [Limimaricola sp.]|nr:sodium:proton antiporter [Limimaricola sp.]MBI1418323.1 sodium:proton antiporter [Limimaricola sp.]